MLKKLGYIKIVNIPELMNFIKCNKNNYENE